MVEEGSLVESLPDRPLRAAERDALEQHERIQSIMPQEMKFHSEHGEIMDTAMFIGHDWVTAVTCFVGHGWRMIYKSDMEDNILADGYL